MQQSPLFLARSDIRTQSTVGSQRQEQLDCPIRTKSGASVNQKLPFGGTPPLFYAPLVKTVQPKIAVEREAYAVGDWLNDRSDKSLPNVSMFPTRLFPQKGPLSTPPCRTNDGLPPRQPDPIWRAPEDRKSNEEKNNKK